MRTRWCVCVWRACVFVCACVLGEQAYIFSLFLGANIFDFSFRAEEKLIVCLSSWMYLRFYQADTN